MNTEQFDGHTPGPWFPPDFGGEGLLDNKGRVMALLVYDEEEPQTSDEWLANAQLIAAAPDLLAEVKRLRLIVHELLKDADHDTHIWFHSNGWCEDLRQPCTVCDSRSDCGQSLINPQ